MTDKAYSDPRKTGSVPRSARAQKGSTSTQLALLLGLLAVSLAFPAKAQMTITDLQIAARALSFMERPLSGTVRMGIVYIPGDAASEAGAESTVQLLGSGLKAGNLLFTPVRVAVKDAGAAAVDLFFLTDGMGERSAPVAAAAEKTNWSASRWTFLRWEKVLARSGCNPSPRFVSSSAAQQPLPPARRS
jgi:hypothetical protein